MKKTYLILSITFAFIACKDIFESDISTTRINIISPQNSVTAPSGEVEFSWREVEYASTLHIAEAPAQNTP